MGSFSDGLEVLILDRWFGASANVQPSVYYIGLSTTTITDAGGNITEPVGSAYTRCAATNNKTTWTNATIGAGALANAIQLSFPQASGSWGTILDFALFDHVTAGASVNFMGYGTLAASKTIQSGDTASFAVGDLDITLG